MLRRQKHSTTQTAFFPALRVVLPLLCSFRHEVSSAYVHRMRHDANTLHSSSLVRKEGPSTRRTTSKITLVWLSTKLLNDAIRLKRHQGPRSRHRECPSQPLWQSSGVSSRERETNSWVAGISSIQSMPHQARSMTTPSLPKTIVDVIAPPTHALQEVAHVSVAMHQVRVECL